MEDWKDEQGFERIVTFRQAFDGRPASKGGLAEWRTPGMKEDDGTSATNYGIGGMDIWFILKGKLGAVQFMLMTQWYPPHVQKEFFDKYGNNTYESHYFRTEPLGADVGYHSPKPMYEGQQPMGHGGECEFVPEGEKCYYDGSGMRAQEWVEGILLKKGSDGVWEALEEEYRRVFIEEAYSDE